MTISGRPDDFWLDAIADADPHPYWFDDVDEPDSNPMLVRTEPSATDADAHTRRWRPMPPRHVKCRAQAP